MPDRRTSWREALSDRHFRWNAIITVVLLPMALGALRSFLNFVEHREGIVLSDPVLDAFGPTDLTWLIFTLIYGGLIVGLLILSRNPKQLVMTVQAYILMIVIRIVCMFSLPLDPPALTIPLRDPFVQLFGSGGIVLTKDLFFSGHTATLVVFGLGMGRGGERWGFFGAAFLVAAALLWQHVHYTVDILVAPLAAYATWKLVRFLWRTQYA